MTRTLCLLIFILSTAVAFAQIDKKAAQALVKITTTDQSGANIGEAAGFALAMGENSDGSGTTPNMFTISPLCLSVGNTCDFISANAESKSSARRALRAVLTNP